MSTRSSPCRTSCARAPSTASPSRVSDRTTWVTVTAAPHAFAFSANGDPEATNHTMYDDRYRLTWSPREDFVELFDHQEDPGECRNLASEPSQRARVQELKRRIADQLATSYTPILGRVSAW